MRQDKTVGRILLIFSIANVVLAAPVLVRQRRLLTDRTYDEPMGEPEQDPAGPDTSSYKGKISGENSALISPSGLHKMLAPQQPASELENSWLQYPSQDRPNQYDGLLDSVWRPSVPPATLKAGDSSHQMLPPPQPSKFKNPWFPDFSQDRPNQYDGSLHSVWRPSAPPATLETGDSLHQMLPPPQPSKFKNPWFPDFSQDRPNQYDGSLHSVWRPSAPPATLETGDSSHQMLPPPQPSKFKNPWFPDFSQDRPNQYDGSLHSVWRPSAPPATLETGDSSHQMLPPPQPSKFKNPWFPDFSQDRPNQYDGSLHSVWRPSAPPATLETGDSSHQMLPPPQPSKFKNPWFPDFSQDRPNQYDGSLHSVWRPSAPPATLETGDSSHQMLPPPQPSKFKNPWFPDFSQDRPNQYDGSLHGVWRPPAPPATLEAGDLSHKMLPPPQPSELKHSWLTDPSQDRWNQWWLHNPHTTLTAWDSSRELLPPALENRPSQIDLPALEDRPSQIDPETLEVHPFDDAWHQLISVKDMDLASTMSWSSDHSEWEEDAAKVADETHFHP